MQFCVEVGSQYSLHGTSGCEKKNAVGVGSVSGSQCYQCPRGQSGQKKKYVQSETQSQA